MPGTRKRPLTSRRRRVDEEGEEDGEVATDLVDDSQSEASIASDADGDADDSDLSEAETAPSLTSAKAKSNAIGAKNDVKPLNVLPPDDGLSPAIARSDTNFTALRDTDVMMNGLKISEGAAGDDEGMDFDGGGDTRLSGDTPQAGDSASANRLETFAERKRREHDEYKKKRDSDPAFIPNRGAFFMHDQRSAAGQNFRGQFGRGRGRGRGMVGGPFSPANMSMPPEATDGPWQHDLHQTVNEMSPPHRPQPVMQPTAVPPHVPSHNHHQPAHFVKPALPAPKAAPVRSFSSTVQTGSLNVRVSLLGMKAPIVFQGVPAKQHTRLPNHRPPLRRDKPVRISLPDHPPRYIFPTIDRSFIFIPRALRPNQQGFGRGRGRGGFGSYGGFSSRRTSAYGGSVYSPSVAMSRRSSMAREMGRDGLVSPAGSVMSRAGGPVERPVVRLPPGGQHPSGPHSVTSPSGGTPVVNMPPPQTYPLPQKPNFRENWQGQIPMHQPRPQKTISVAGIESPASIKFHAPQQVEQQPFHQQVPAHMNGANGATAPTEPPTFYPHSRQLSYPSQASTGTPLSNIPERAIHAPAFQPFQQPGFPPQAFPMQPGFYYPPPANGPQPQFAAPGMVPMFVPNPQAAGYVMPVPPPPTSTAPTSAPPPAMMAYEQNGMTYYYDPSQMYQQPAEGYAPASYAVPGMGGMMTPSPDGYYYPQVPVPAQGQVFYPQQ
ncbi:hypothetical protein BU16DRAFT_473911 [Lophium mytilinum]|uniref:Btz domain-containing protein n=1 Tax=Lophium mytilinum TaxID=390894 RepID=A0A6A6Q8P8_9PEZI|nr:hypothetical protein BU16DRAFT_473911 [Lophium mytilinum]